MANATMPTAALHEEETSARAVQRMLEALFEARSAASEALRQCERLSNAAMPRIGGDLDDARDEAFRQKASTLAKQAAHHAREFEASLLDWQGLYGALRGR